jgi:hypothetical protein
LLGLQRHDAHDSGVPDLVDSCPVEAVTPPRYQIATQAGPEYDATLVFDTQSSWRSRHAYWTREEAQVEADRLNAGGERA